MTANAPVDVTVVFNLRTQPRYEFWIVYIGSKTVIFSWEDFFWGIDHSPGFSVPEDGGWTWVYPRGSNGEKIVRLSIQKKPLGEEARMMASGALDRV